jgi:hypothetical protein
MADITYSPDFKHEDWIDNEDVVQAGGEKGFNIKFHNIEKEFDKLASVATVANDTFNTIDSSLATMRGRVDACEARVQDVAEKVNELTSQLQNMNALISDVHTSITNLQRRIPDFKIVKVGERLKIPKNNVKIVDNIDTLERPVFYAYHVVMIPKSTGKRVGCAVLYKRSGQRVSVKVHFYNFSNMDVEIDYTVVRSWVLKSDILTISSSISGVPIIDPALRPLTPVAPIQPTPGPPDG